MVTLAMNGDSERQQHLSMLKKWNAEVNRYETQLPKTLGANPQKENVHGLFCAYMQKAAHHYHLGENDNQLSCYKNILTIPALSNVDKARTHTNIAVVHLRLNRSVAAACHLTKAEELVSIAALEKAMGPQTLSVFPTVYYKASLDLFMSCPEQAVIYLRKVLRFPEQQELPHTDVHLYLAVSYDRLLKFDDSLEHACQVLSHQSLSPKVHDRALCYAAAGSYATGKLDNCIEYFQKINTVKNLINNEERYLALSAVGGSHIKKGNWEKGFSFMHQALDSLGTSSPHYLPVKYDLGIAYGRSGDKQKEREVYSEILDAIGNHTFESSYPEEIRSIQRSIETFFFMKEMDKFEQRFKKDLLKKKEESEKNKKTELTKRKQEKEKQKERSHQRLIEKIKFAQREAVEREKQLEQDRLQRLESEKKRAEERKKYGFFVQGSAQEELDFISFAETRSESSEQVPLKPKVKTHGISAPCGMGKDKEETQRISQNIKPALPPLGTQAQAVFSQIEDEDWTFTREEYSCYLKDLQCIRRDSGSSHRIFQLPKSVIISLKKNGNEIQEELFLVDEDVALGSITLPAWKGDHVPFYLRKQIRSLHEKVITLYTKVTEISTP